MKVSVIIPCFNSDKYIEQAIFSAIAQKTNFDFEILVRDDFSTDKSQQVIERVTNYDWAVTKVFKPTENWGEMRNVKFLYEQAKGEYIAHLDGDDYWTTTNKLQRQVDFMDANPDFSVCFTGGWHGFSDGSYEPSNVNQWLCHNLSLGSEISIEQEMDGNYVTFGRMYRNRSDMITPWIVENWQKTVWYNDWATSYEATKRGRVKYLDFPTTVYRIRSDGVYQGSSIIERDERIITQRAAMVLDYAEYTKKEPR